MIGNRWKNSGKKGRNIGNKGSYIGKGINNFLFISIIVLLLVVVFFTVYFQGLFGDVSQTKEDISDKLRVCENRLSNFKEQLNKTISSLKTTELDIRKYDVLYENKTTQLSDALKELDTVRKNLKDTEDELDTTKTKLAKAQSDVSDLQGQVNTLYAQLDDKQSLIDDLTNEVSCLRKLNHAPTNNDC